MSNKKTITRNYYPSGALYSESELSGGKPDGYHREYFESGAIKSEAFSISGRYHGRCRQWRGDGSLLGEFIFENGTGLYVVWYDTGGRQFEIEMADGQFHGFRKLYDLAGKCVLTDYFVRGKKSTKKRLLESRIAEAITPNDAGP